MKQLSRAQGQSYNSLSYYVYILCVCVGTVRVYLAKLFYSFFVENSKSKNN